MTQQIYQSNQKLQQPTDDVVTTPMKHGEFSIDGKVNDFSDVRLMND